MQRDLLAATEMARDGQFRRPFFDALIALIEARETVVSKDLVRVRKMTRTVVRCGYQLPASSGFG